MTNYNCKNPECGFGWSSEDRLESNKCPECGHGITTPIVTLEQIQKAMDKMGIPCTGAE